MPSVCEDVYVIHICIVLRIHEDICQTYTWRRLDIYMKNAFCMWRRICLIDIKRCMSCIYVWHTRLDIYTTYMSWCMSDMCVYMSSYMYDITSWYLQDIYVFMYVRHVYKTYMSWCMSDMCVRHVWHICLDVCQTCMTYMSCILVVLCHNGRFIVYVAQRMCHICKTYMSWCMYGMYVYMSMYVWHVCQTCMTYMSSCMYDSLYIRHRHVWHICLDVCKTCMSDMYVYMSSCMYDSLSIRHRHASCMYDSLYTRHICLYVRKTCMSDMYTRHIWGGYDE